MIRQHQIQTSLLLLATALGLATFVLIFAINDVGTVQPRAAGVAWDGGGDGVTWEDDDNWDNDSSPTAADDVTIDSNVTVTISGTTTINSLTLGNGGGSTTPTLEFAYDAIAGTALILDDGNLVVNTGATLTHSDATTVVVGSIFIDVQTGTATIDGTIDLDEKGYIEEEGPEAGTLVGVYGGGGGNGGEGGDGNGTDGTTGQGGGVAGSITAPTVMGSGGASDPGGIGGDGGGAVRIDVAGTLDIDGTITADGQTSTSSNRDPGGGAGGSVYLTTDGALTGTGSIGVNGGGAPRNGGSGGGGRIALHYDADSSSIARTAYGGTTAICDHCYGGAGTIYLNDTTGADTDTLIIDNNNTDLSSTEIDDRFIGRTPLTDSGAASFTFDNLTLQNDGNLDLNSDTTLTVNSTFSWTSGGILTDNGGIFDPISTSSNALTVPGTAQFYANTARTYAGLTVSSGATITGSNNSTTGAGKVYEVNLTVNGATTIDGTIAVDSRGYYADNGPDPGTLVGTYAGGGGHGGVGGDGFGGVSTTGQGGSINGSITAPVTLGSGGGSDPGGVGGRGGGVIRLAVTGSLDIDGTITADGELAQASNRDPGGGAGGSVYITTTGSLTGTGVVEAVGRPGARLGGSGGGGRIAIYFDADSSSITPLASGGAGPGSCASCFGGAGTVYLKDTTGGGTDELVIDNNGNDLAVADDRFSGRTLLTDSGAASFTYDTVTIQNDGNLDLTTDTTVNYTTLNWTGGQITDNGGTLTAVTGGGVLTVPTGSKLFANTVRSYTSVTVNGQLTHSQNADTENEYSLDITTTGGGDFTIASGGSVDVTGAGHVSGFGQGAGIDAGSFGSGAGHGGTGGDTTDGGTTGGSTYGSGTAPTLIGSGGGPDQGLGGYGGGAVKITVSGDLQVDGTISAGAADNAGNDGGGGSGGSVWLIVTGAVDGAGAIDSDGGSANHVNSGAGAGGRIAIQCSDGSSWTSTVTVATGTVGIAAGAGTYSDTCSASLPAGDPEITATVSNESPQLLDATVKLCDNTGAIANSDVAISACSDLLSVNLVAGSTLSVSLFGTVRDNNGANDIAVSGHTAAYYHSANASPTSESCTDDNNNCYDLSGSKAATINSTDAWIRFDFDLEYYTDPSTGAPTWVGYASTLDAASATDDNGGNEYTNEISSIVSMTFPDVVYGAVSLPFTSTSGNNIEIDHQNNGNVTADVDLGLDGGSMTCSGQGSIGTSSIRLDTSDLAYGSMTKLMVASPATVNMDIDIAQRTNDTAAQSGEDIETSYWGLSVSSGVLGACTGTINATVFEGP